MLAVKAAGVETVPVTGRPYEMAEPVVSVQPFARLGIFDGGATIQHNKTGEIIWKNWLEPETIRAIVGIVDPHCSAIGYEPGYHPERRPGVDLETITLACSGVFAVIPSVVAPQILDQIAAIEHIICFGQPGHAGLEEQHVLQIGHREATKAHAIAVLLDMMGVDKAHTAAIGDGNNDEPMLEFAAETYAMGNATDRLKAVANRVVADYEHDGWAEAAYDMLRRRLLDDFSDRRH